jgi:hypothetical protein
MIMHYLYIQQVNLKFTEVCKFAEDAHGKYSCVLSDLEYWRISKAQVRLNETGKFLVTLRSFHDYQV